jgi:hypothetical protein
MRTVDRHHWRRRRHGDEERREDQPRTVRASAGFARRVAPKTRTRSGKGPWRLQEVVTGDPLAPAAEEPLAMSIAHRRSAVRSRLAPPLDPSATRSRAESCR